MAATTDFSRFFIQDNFPQMNGFGCDIGAFMDSCRKNAEALSQAQQLALEGMQRVAQRQTEIVTRIMKDSASLASEIMGDSTPEQKMARQADLLKKNYEQSVSAFRELTDMLGKSGMEASDVLNRRVSASFSEMKSTLEKTGKAAGARQKAAA